jgi:hypothetical protein
MPIDLSVIDSVQVSKSRNTSGLTVLTIYSENQASAEDVLYAGNSGHSIWQG